MKTPLTATLLLLVTGAVVYQWWTLSPFEDGVTTAVAAGALLTAPLVFYGSLSPSPPLSQALRGQLLWTVLLFGLLQAPLYLSPGEEAPEEWVSQSIETTSAADPQPEPELSTLLASPPAEDTRPAEIILPYEGGGRRLSIPVVFSHNGREVETTMMLDTGATYTTLPLRVLRELGIQPSSADPTLTLNTANGKRETTASLVDTVWLGDLAVEGVAVTVCEECASREDVGLLGLNVSGGYRVTIDSDDQVVIFNAQDQFDRHLDIRLFTRLSARFQTRGVRTSAVFTLDNPTPRNVFRAVVNVSCGEQRWTFPLDPTPGRSESKTKVFLPRHEPCERYRFSLEDAWW